MPAGKKRRSNVGILLMIAGLFLALGFLVSRGFLAIGFVFFIIALASIGRPQVRFFEDEEGADEE